MNPEIIQPIIHYGLHFIAPGIIAYIFFKKYWRRAWGIMILTMLADIDHLFGIQFLIQNDVVLVFIFCIHTMQLDYMRYCSPFQKHEL